MGTTGQPDEPGGGGQAGVGGFLGGGGGGGNAGGGGGSVGGGGGGEGTGHGLLQGQPPHLFPSSGLPGACPLIGTARAKMTKITANRNILILAS